MSDPVLADAGFTDVDAEFQEFAVDAGRAPKPIVAAQFHESVPERISERRSARLAIHSITGVAHREHHFMDPAPRRRHAFG